MRLLRRSIVLGIVLAGVSTGPAAAQDLRSPDARAQAAPAGVAVVDLRSPDARSAGQPERIVIEPEAVSPAAGDEAVFGSATIGAATAVVLALVGTAWTFRRRRRLA